MEQNRDKDKWVEEIISGAESIKRAEAGPYLYPKILHRIRNNRSNTNTISLRRAALGMITVVLLAVLNLFVIFRNAENTQKYPEGYMESRSSSTDIRIIPSQVNPYLEILENY